MMLRWRQNYSPRCYCDQTDIANNKTIGPLNSDILCKLNCLTNVGEIVGSTDTYCVSYSTQDNWSYGTATFDHEFPMATYVEFTFEGNAWAALTTFGYNFSGFGYYSVKCKLDTVNRTDTNEVNYAPLTIMPPVVTIRAGFSYQLSIPTTDQDPMVDTYNLLCHLNIFEFYSIIICFRTLLNVDGLNKVWTNVQVH